MGTFILKKTANGEYMFNLKAGNGEVIATSENYTTSKAARSGIESVRKNAVAAVLEDQTVNGFETQKHPKFEIFKDKSGQFRFRLKGAKGEIIAKSEGYTVKASAKNGIASVQKNAPEAKLVEQE